MASGNNDISDIVKKCRVLLLDIEGTTTSISFVKVGLMIDRPVFCLNMCFCVTVVHTIYILFIVIFASMRTHDPTCKMVAISDSQHGGRNQNGTPFMFLSLSELSTCS